MYTVSKGPSKFVAKTRIGVFEHYKIVSIFSNFDLLGIPSHVENAWDAPKKKTEINYEDVTNMMDISKPVFVQLNNKKLYDMRSQETSTPEHEEIVKFVSENWSSVACKSNDSLSIKNGCSPIYYQVNEGNNKMKDFEPFDLDTWWGKRIFNTITKSVP